MDLATDKEGNNILGFTVENTFDNGSSENEGRAISVDTAGNLYIGGIVGDDTDLTLHLVPEILRQEL